ncbi:MAG TPA: ABC transporter ATP-binding protein [Anaerolineales bacterium]
MAGLHVHYGASHVLHGVTLEVPEASATAIVGRNGVGKTTLIHTIMGMLPASQGQLSLGELDLLSRPPYQRKRLGLALVPQGRRLFGSLTVEEHLGLVEPIRPGPYSPRQIYALFPSLEKRRRSLARTLSGGERSMLSLSRALVLNPTLLLMDEPTEGLAPLLVKAIEEVVLELCRTGMTILLVEQKLSLALAVSERIAVMQRGEIADLYERDRIQDVETLGHLILHAGEGGSR